jgi:hypothetical protein
VSSIPLSFREQDLVEVAEGELWGSDFLFLIEKEELTFSDAFQLNTRFRKASNLQPLFVLKGLNRSLNRLLMDANIAFVTADGFTYIPSVLIAGKMPASNKSEPLIWHDSYIPVAHYFLLNPLARLNSLQLQAQLPFYSRALIIKALAILAQIQFLKKEGAVRTTTYSLAYSLAESYALIKERLINPIRFSCYVKESDAVTLPKNVFSSESALSHYSMIVPYQDSYLMSLKDYREHRQLFVGEKERAFDQNYYRYDVFAYAPLTQREDGASFLNPLDVIAIYRQDKDPRVELAIQAIEKRFQ